MFSLWRCFCRYDFVVWCFERIIFGLGCKNSGNEIWDFVMLVLFGFIILCVVDGKYLLDVFWSILLIFIIKFLKLYGILI